MAQRAVTEDPAVLRLKLEATDRLINWNDERLVQLHEMMMTGKVRHGRNWAFQLLKVAKQIWQLVPVNLIPTSLIAADLVQVRQQLGQRDEELRLGNQIRQRLTTIREMQSLTRRMQQSFPKSYASLPFMKIEGFVPEVLGLVLDVSKFLDTLRKPALTLRAQLIERLNQSTSTIGDSGPQLPDLSKTAGKSPQSGEAAPTTEAKPAIPEVWPPDSGWNFAPGQFAFHGRAGKLKGVPWKLLKALSGSPHGLTKFELRQRVWAGDQKTDDTIRTTVSKVRKSLRRTFGLGDEDPIPAQDTGERLAWCIDEGLLESLSTKPEKKRQTTQSVNASVVRKAPVVGEMPLKPSRDKQNKR